MADQRLKGILIKRSFLARENTIRYCRLKILLRMMTFKDFQRELVSWCFEPSQPQRLTSGLKRKRERERERELAGALSPANHKGL